MSIGIAIVTRDALRPWKRTRQVISKARELGIEVVSMPMDLGYPLVKCNVNRGEKIYHLPFDQQYDRVKIVAAKSEYYVGTAKEAEAKGFRRAKRFIAVTPA